MNRQQAFALVLGLSAVNGILSPYLDFVVALSPIWLPNWLPGSPGMLFYASSLLTATTTLLLSGMPAALAERFVPGVRGSGKTTAIWAVAALVLTLPGLVRLSYLVAQ